MGSHLAPLSAWGELALPVCTWCFTQHTALGFDPRSAILARHCPRRLADRPSARARGRNGAYCACPARSQSLRAPLGAS